MDSDVHGIIVSGEASESDEEEELYYSSSHVAEVQTKTEVENDVSHRRKRSNIQNSLLHKKLWEANISLVKHLDTDFKLPISSAASSISKLSSDMRTLYSSAVLTNSNVNQASTNVELIVEKLASISNEHLPKTTPDKR